jgi:formylglycine-generating enzyme required for sulfatase activity
MAAVHGGITRTGSAGSYTYATVSGRENNPVNYVSFWNATRFANWLHNGQPSGTQDVGTTETGAYTLGGVTNPPQSITNTITRNAGATWALPTEDEWYKAAYYQPASEGGDSDNYWLFPTSSNTITAEQANHAYAISEPTPVGSYAANFYGTFDMAGNVFEWSDLILGGPSRVYRGGSFESDESYLYARDRYESQPSNADAQLGFRVAYVPGPSSVALLTIGGLTASRRRRA